uniref:Uncharacterized protein n=1 Tax=Romanomermis culicivorax TaxID=13658 RepID=A0A915JQZ3_ROMCU
MNPNIEKENIARYGIVLQQEIQIFFNSSLQRGLLSHQLLNMLFRIHAEERPHAFGEFFRFSQVDHVI